MLRLFIILIISIAVSHSVDVGNYDNDPAVILPDSSCCAVRRENPTGNVHPKGYKLTPNIGWHKYYPIAVNWSEAFTACHRDGAHLAIVNTWEEAIMMSKVMNKTGVVKGAYVQGEASIGLHDFFGKFVTVHGQLFEDLQFKRWTWKYGGAPDHYHSPGSQKDYHCCAFESGIAVDDIKCYENFPYFCEIPLCKVL